MYKFEQEVPIYVKALHRLVIYVPFMIAPNVCIFSKLPYSEICIVIFCLIELTMGFQ